jgi:hypothetical protein
LAARSRPAAAWQVPVPADTREAALPRRSRLPWWGMLALVGIAALTAGVLIGRRQQAAPPRMEAAVVAPADAGRSVPLPEGAVARPPLAVAPTQSSAAPPTAPEALPPARRDSTPSAARVDTPPRPLPGLQPHYGSGLLWVQPMVAPPREIASMLTGKTGKELTDSLVTAMVQSYLDAMAKEQAENPNTLPSWTTRVGGKTVGLDSRWIYLGPLKIPTMLLALLPIHIQGNPTQAEFNAKLQVMRADLMEAGRRAATYDDFKQAMKDLRQQTEDARQFKANQRTAPDTSHSG